MASWPYALQVGTYRQYPPSIGESSSRYPSIMSSSTRATGPVGPPSEAAEALLVLTIHLPLRGLQDLPLGQQHQVVGALGLAPVATERLAQQPARAVAGHRGTHPPAHGQAQPIVTTVVHGRHQCEESSVHPGSLPEDPLELSSAVQTVLGPEPLAEPAPHAF